MDEGPCKASKLSFYFNVNTHKCETFLYGGCLGNANNFETLAECEEKCLVTHNLFSFPLCLAGKNPCHLEEEPGPCRGVFTRYFFNSSAQKCDRMIYGGCFGNANNFKTLKDCQATCHKKKPHTVEDSDKHTDTKPNIIPVIYFDIQAYRCIVSFPRLHDFDREFFCIRLLALVEYIEVRNINDRILTISLLTGEKMRLLGLTTTVYCTEGTGSSQYLHISPKENMLSSNEKPLKHERVFQQCCERKTLGQCHTDINLLHKSDLTTVNSSSPELDSRRADLDRPDFCWSRPDRGTCDGSMKRYFFNPKKMRCHAFRYSGCGGNKNNFVSKEDCRKTCMKGI
ncbi:TFPI1 inhibitor, partial [Atractosteus spatula]|nr:TFPI1 inhibitor [Atractosteus spatula]